MEKYMSTRSALRTYSKHLIGLFVLLTAVCYWQPVSAQSKDTNDNADHASGHLEEVFVTAQRRKESLQSVPMAITAFSSDEMDRRGIVDLRSLAENAPAFRMAEFNMGQPLLSIRGIRSYDDGAGADQSVVIFIDEVYIGRQAGLDIDLFDLERVEVLRGPQGTLFGKNVVGGAINLITSKPNEDAEVALQASYGNFNALTLRGKASGPLADNLFGKISFSSQQRDGYLQNQAFRFPEVFPANSSFNRGAADDDLLRLDRQSLRGQLRFVPSDVLEINLTANISQAQSSSAGARHFTGPDGVNFLADSRLIPNYADNYRYVLVDDPGQFDGETASASLRFDWDFSQKAMFTSLTSYRDIDTKNIETFGTERLSSLRIIEGGVPQIPDGNNDYTETSDTFTQEFRLTSTDESALKWVAGVYYLSEDTIRYETVSLGVRVPDGAGGVATLIPNILGGDLQDNSTKSYAVFGQMTYAFSDRWSITVGARQTWEEKDIIRDATFQPLSIPGGPYTGANSADWSSFTPKVSVDFQATESAFIYATISDGFKSGGFQGLAPSLLAAITPFNPEEARMYELGAKTEWLDDTLRLNVAVSHTDYTDMQVTMFLVPNDAPEGLTEGLFLTQNAAASEIKALELELEWLPTQNLSFSGYVTLLDAKYTDFYSPPGYHVPGGSAAGDSRIGENLGTAPDWTYNILGRYRVPLSNGSTLSLQGNYLSSAEIVQGKLYFAAIPEYQVANFNVTWSNAEGNISIMGWMNNAFDEEYLLYNTPAMGSGFATAALPRTYGITVNWRR